VTFHDHFSPQHQFLSNYFVRRSPIAALNGTSTYTFPGLIKTHFPLQLTPTPISAAIPIVPTRVGECFIVGVRSSDSCIKVVRGSSLAELFCLCSYPCTVIPYNLALIGWANYCSLMSKSSITFRVKTHGRLMRLADAQRSLEALKTCMSVALTSIVKQTNTVFYFWRVFYWVRLEFQEILGKIFDNYLQILLITASNMNLELAHSCVLRVTVIIFPEVKRSWCQTDHLTSSNAEVKNEWTYTPWGFHDMLLSTRARGHLPNFSLMCYILCE
jgi:hypothetical protein